MINLRVWENFLVPISVTLSQGHQTTEVGQILTGTHDKVRANHPIATKLLRYTPLVKISTWLNCGGIISVIFFDNLFHKISNAFFPYRTFYLSYLRNGWCKTKRKWVNWMLRWLGCLWPWPLILNFQGQIVSWEWDFKVKSGICYISAKNGSISTTKKGKHIDWTLGLKWDHRVWPWPWPWPWIFKVKCLIATKRKANISIELQASNGTMILKGEVWGSSR